MTSATETEEAIRFCDDGVLLYSASRRRFEAGEALQFDEAYRLAHLPLVAPGHPAIIREVPGRGYRDGRYAESRYGLVAPVAWDALAASPAFQALDREMRESSFAPKIAWELGERRRSQLHATIAGPFHAERVEPYGAALAARIAQLGTLRFRLGGPFVGTRNWGRIYFPAYPQQVEEDDMFALMQDTIGVPRRGFYGIGFYHLADPLDAQETADLARILDHWRDAAIAELPLTSMVIHATNDDLVLSGRTVMSIAAGSGRIERHGPNSGNTGIDGS